MIVVTGAAGFIGSNVVAGLNNRNYKDIVLVDDFSIQQKAPNYQDKVKTELVERSQFFEWLKENHRMVQMVIHMGARTDTAEFEWAVFEELNLGFSKTVFDLCLEFGLPLIYASSAATYGGGEHGYDDAHSLVKKLQPLNPYGKSKNEFDQWVLKNTEKPFFWAGLKFFNVYGPNEYHKGRMASVVFQAYNQISATGKMNLFRSHNPDYHDGEQLRDFIYVKDVVDIIIYLMEERPESGLYNLGTGSASTFRDLVSHTFHSMDLEPAIQYIDTPEDIRDKYQYFTEAKMDKLRESGYDRAFTSLEEGVLEYVKEYLVQGGYH